jgi:hypothetical protein
MIIVARAVFRARVAISANPCRMVPRYLRQVTSGAIPVRIAAVNGASARVFFIHTDHLNTPRLVADATGTTV